VKALYVEPTDIPGLVNARQEGVDGVLIDLTMAQAKYVAAKRGLRIVPVRSLAEAMEGRSQ
jgi:hypothetical protein